MCRMVQDATRDLERWERVVTRQLYNNYITTMRRKATRDLGYGRCVWGKRYGTVQGGTENDRRFREMGACVEMASPLSPPSH